MLLREIRLGAVSPIKNPVKPEVRMQAMALLIDVFMR
jgi:hypothetical protein